MRNLLDIRCELLKNLNLLKSYLTSKFPVSKISTHVFTHSFDPITALFKTPITTLRFPFLISLQMNLGLR